MVLGLDGMYDLLIRRGTVVDPSQGLHEKMDVALSKGVVEAVEKSISPDLALEWLDAMDLLVTPGLVDLHVHVYPGVSHYGTEPDPYCVWKGATTVLDAGSSGAYTFEGFRRHVVSTSATRVLAFLNISSMGMISPGVGELEDIRFADVDRAIDVCERNRDVIRGVKVRLSKSIVGENGLLPLKLAKRVASAVKMPLMVHPGNTPSPLPEILDELEGGDILTHCYHGSEQGILNHDGAVIDEVLEAKRRGVVFDVGHGMGSFSFDVAAKALTQGFHPTTISTDLHHYNTFGPVYDLATTMTKFIALGMSLDDVVAKTTTTPAQVLREDKNLGTLRRGSAADVVIFGFKGGRYELVDALGKTVTCERLLTPVAVVRAGKVYTSSLKLTGRRTIRAPR
jgi:dihydroorotase